MRPVLLLLLSALPASAVQSIDPVERYSAMMEQSPFALATAAEEPAVPTESFAANWDLTALAKVRNESGMEVEFVSIRSRDKQLSFTLVGNQESTNKEAAGVSLQSVDWQPGARKSTVMLKRGTEVAKVEFSQEIAAPAAPAVNPMNPNQVRTVQQQAAQVRAQQLQLQQQQAAGQKVRPGAQLNNGAINLGTLTNSAIQRPPNGAAAQNFYGSGVVNVGNGLNNVAPNSPAVVYPQAPGLNTGTTNTPDPRRRLRVINSQP